MSEENKNKDWRFRHEEEGYDIYDLHHAPLREYPEPKEGMERPPWWLWVISVLLIFWAGFYLGRYSGDFGPYVHILYEPDRKAAVIDNDTAPNGLADVDGSAIYANACAACHQANGQGVPGAFPPLAGTQWVIEDPETPVRIVLHGMKGQVEVKGNVYDGVMPGLGHRLDDAEVAAVVNHIRTSWGNSASEIGPELVREVRRESEGRTEQWTADELMELR